VQNKADLSARQHSLIKPSNHECEIQYGDNKKRLYVYIFSFQNASAQAALQAASALSGQNETQGGPNTVLRVIVEHMVYPVTLEVLCQVSGSSQVAAYWNAPPLSSCLFLC
jgi:hypothetical protein